MQLLEFNATGGLTLAAKLFALGSDTIVSTAGTVTEKTNHKNRYVAAFEDVEDGAYSLVAFVGAVGGFANEIYDVAGDGTFYPRSELHRLDAIETKLDAIKGPGDTSWSIAVKTSSGNPISGCECWVATDAQGNSVITDIQSTDANGVVEFLLDPGTYYLFRRKQGITFTNPQTITVT